MLLDLRSLLEAAASNTYDGIIPCHSGVSAVCSGPVAQDDSRGYVLKRHGQAFPAGARAQARNRLSKQAGNAAVAVAGGRALMTAGRVRASGRGAQQPGRIQPAHVRAGRVKVSANATAALRGHRAISATGRAFAGADAAATVAGVHGRARAGRVSVEVGPDLELLELEELLLLEVA